MDDGFAACHTINSVQREESCDDLIEYIKMVVGCRGEGSLSALRVCFGLPGPKFSFLLGLCLFSSKQNSRYHKENKKLGKDPRNIQAVSELILLDSLC
jgi:hypothetical protein